VVSLPPVTGDEFASHREQVESLLRLVDEYGLSELDRDRIYETTRGQPVARFEDHRAQAFADRLGGLLETAERELPSDQVVELRRLIGERLRGSF
jgi:hypothetical protein